MSLKRKPAVRNRCKRDQLFLANMRLVGYMTDRLCKSYKPVRVMGRDEALQVGYVRLLRAAELWEEGRGVQFSTYACRAIQTGICQEALRS